MNWNESTIKLIFKTFSKEELDRLERKDLIAFFESVGLKEYCGRIPDKYYLSYDNILSIIKDIKKQTEEEDSRRLFNQYSNEYGFIEREGLEKMFMNHLSSFTRNQIELVLDDYFKQSSSINYEQFKQINLF